MNNICFILGTRPEAIKMAPVILAVKKMGFQTFVITTGQHRELLPLALETFDIEADKTFDLMKEDQDANIFLELCKTTLAHYFESKSKGKSKPFSYVFVQGDTASAYAGAWVAKDFGIPIGHIEAGIRSHDLEEPWPEEFYRRSISKIATQHFTPSSHASENLIQEGIAKMQIFITGNTIIDALHSLDVKAISEQKKKNLILLSVHRRENISRYADEMIALLREVISTFSEFSFMVILHPNPKSISLIEKSIEGFKNVKIYPPLSYPEMIKLAASCDLFLTDSGGLQEEASELKIPIVVLRGVTDRPESIGKGAFLVGRNVKACLLAIHEGLETAVLPCNPFGQVGASQRIALILKRFLEK